MIVKLTRSLQLAITMAQRQVARSIRLYRIAWEHGTAPVLAQLPATMFLG